MSMIVDFGERGGDSDEEGNQRDGGGGRRRRHVDPSSRGDDANGQRTTVRRGFFSEGTQQGEDSAYSRSSWQRLNPLALLTQQQPPPQQQPEAYENHEMERMEEDDSALDSDEDDDSAMQMEDGGDGRFGQNGTRSGGRTGGSMMDEDAIDAFLTDSVNAVTAPPAGVTAPTGPSATATDHVQLQQDRPMPQPPSASQYPGYGDQRHGQDDVVDAQQQDSGGALQQQHGEEPASQPNNASDASQERPPPPVRDEGEKRRAIQAIMRDRSISEPEKRLRIQQVMDGRSNPPNGTRDERGGPMDENDNMASHARLGNGYAHVGGPQHHPGIPHVSSATRPAAHAVVPECLHYERKCNLVAPCCNRVFGCRICHDEATSTEADHPPLDRHKVTEIVCKICNQRQNAKTNTCIRCQNRLGEYHCVQCNLWMALSTRPFHCDKCGICRVGGRENYVHCDQCCMCLSTQVYAHHKCIKEKFKNNCPVCQENLFASRQAPQDLPCGHAIHSHCFRTLASFDYRCPVCKKTIVSQTTMASAWSSRAREIEVQPMPPDLIRVVSIICNDCGEKSDDRMWHFLGVQCPRCTSFNTVVDNMAPGEEDGSADGPGEQPQPSGPQNSG